MPEASDGPPQGATGHGAGEALVQQVLSLARRAVVEDSSDREDGAHKMDALDLEDKKQNIGLKKIYGGWLLGTLIVQLIFTNLVFLLVGAKKLEYPDSATIQVFVGATMIEVAILIRMILKSLFPEKKA